MPKFGIFVFIAVAISLGFFSLMTALAVRLEVCRNGATPYECGFDPKCSARTPFSMRFFLLAVIFLVFDVEVVLLFPVLFVITGDDVVYGVGRFLYFLLILFCGLFHEWEEGSLDWV